MQEYLTFMYHPKYSKQTHQKDLSARHVGLQLKMSLYVDYHLGPLVTNHPSYIKDANNFVTKIQDIGELPAASSLVTLMSPPFI